MTCTRLRQAMGLATLYAIGGRALLSPRAADGLPVDTVYGVNIGNWLVMEPWMSPNEWLEMDGQICDDCLQCRMSEWDLANHLGQNQTNDKFQEHWQSWLNQTDVDQMKAAKLNTVRVPLGFWILEDIVDRKNEPYAQGGLDELIRGLNMFKDAGLNVLLGQHAMPGVHTPDNMFAGKCTTDVQFYAADQHNFQRAVTWSAALAFLAHTHPAFAGVFALEAINEPTQDAGATPGIGAYYAAFVRGVRAVEYGLGLDVDGDTFSAGAASADNITKPALDAAAPILARLADAYKLGTGTTNITAVFGGSALSKGALSEFVADGQTSPLVTVFMTKSWQHGDAVANPADAAAGGAQAYDAHQYLNFGGVAPGQNETSYLQTICGSSLITGSVQNNNTPLIGGEWSLATGFNASTDFLKQFGDAQKTLFTQPSGGRGWVFWSWKMEPDVLSYPIHGQAAQWGYRDALANGLVTADPGDVFDSDVCKSFGGLKKTKSGATRHATVGWTAAAAWALMLVLCA